MNDILQQYSILELCAIAYLTLAFVKITLCLSNVSVAAGVMRRKMGQHSIIFYFVVASILTALVVFFRTPLALRTEGWRFFLVYPDRKVMRDVLSGL